MVKTLEAVDGQGDALSQLRRPLQRARHGRHVLGHRHAPSVHEHLHVLVEQLL